LSSTHQTGKIAQSDYLAQREVLLQRGAQLLQRLEAERDAALESAVRAARQSKVEN
jgi:hypothetical protein